MAAVQHKRMHRGPRRPWSVVLRRWRGWTAVLLFLLLLALLPLVLLGDLAPANHLLPV